MVANPEATTWDTVIVGTGIGGATLGHALAKSGQRVLFLERGLDLRIGNQAIRGQFVEETPGFHKLAEEKKQEALKRGGRSTDQATDQSNGASTTFHPYIGCGTGGSSALYGMVLERLFPADFRPREVHTDTPGSTLPDAWPIGYDDLRPWYERAEQLYRVRGGADPLRPGEETALLPAPPFTAEGAEIVNRLARQELHPYRLHTACERAEDCDTCQGRLCGGNCKNEASGVCLTPALERYGAQLLTECAALYLDADDRRVSRLICSWRGERIELRSRIFVLAAGALLTPALLLNSKSSCWPNGLANRSDMVGRNLMRHSIDLHVLTKAPPLRQGFLTKEIAFNDLYSGASGKLGTVQSFGTASPLAYLQSRPGFNVWRMMGPAAKLIWNKFGRQPILGAILEDLPMAQNRVLPTGPVNGKGQYRLRVQYRLSEGDLTRRMRFRGEIAERLSPFRPIRAPGTTELPALGHACGTVRFGSDPTQSVLDPNNRAHDLENLYVVDGSFFPSSGGVNPALTIAANALRVAEKVSAT